MSDRANGWLLIVGGLTIGLVLWLSPEKAGASPVFGDTARKESDPLICAIVAWQRAGAKHMVRIGALCPGECREVC